MKLLKNTCSIDWSRRKVFIYGVVLGFALCALLTGVITKIDDAWGAEKALRHVVVRGDTLSGIAERYLGDYRKYHYLAEINDLKIERIGEIDYVWLKIGQTIYLEPKITVPPRMKKAIAGDTIVNTITSIFSGRYGMTYEGQTDVDRKWALAPVRTVEEGTSTEDIRRLFKASLRRSEWVDMVETWEAIMMNAEVADDALFLAAVVEAESDFRNVNGSHGEIGVMQIKPQTAYNWFKARNPDIWVSEVRDGLENIALNVECGWFLLQSYGCKENKTEALHEYNRGSRRVAYAKRVMQRYNRNLRVYEKAIKKYIREMQDGS